jgi:hypothetical protein
METTQINGWMTKIGRLQLVDDVARLHVEIDKLNDFQ